ncbi:MAG: S8 family serine peptidase, partial [Sulfurovum sp.]|nr:S8 family serine peptidase [Sulfurovum sp.]
FAKIAGSNWLDTQTLEGLEKAWLTGNGANEIAVSNNSWGLYFDTDTSYEDLMALGTSTLRDGKGRVYVFAAGNDRVSSGNANLAYTLSNRYAIAVAGLKHDNTFAEYSSQGSNILVSAYSGNFSDDSPTIGTTTVAGKATTNITWSEDTLLDYTFAMNGTSSASPMVAASVALVLEACPSLGWRDIKYLIAKHAKQIDNTNSSWIRNAVELTHSIDYGFGLIDASEMIDDCTNSYTNLSAELSHTVSQTYNRPIVDFTSESFDISFPLDMTIEWVEVTIDSDSTYASDYQIELVSPLGTKTTLMSPIANPDIVQFNIGYYNWMSGGFRLSTTAMMGEASFGTWRVIVKDELTGDEGTLKNIQLKVYGH